MMKTEFGVYLRRVDPSILLFAVFLLMSILICSGMAIVGQSQIIGKAFLGLFGCLGFLYTWKKPTSDQVLQVMCLTVVAGLTLFAAGYISTYIETSGEIVKKPVDFYTAVIGAPISEELFFRVFLLRLLSEKNGLIGGCIISSLIFSVIHGYGVVESIGVMFFGLVACLLVMIPRVGLLVAMVFHGFWNYLGYLANLP